MNIDPKEKEKFNKIAEEWWDPSGKFAPLHKICLLYTSPSPRD